MNPLVQEFRERLLTQRALHCQAVAGLDAIIADLPKLAASIAAAEDAADGIVDAVEKEHLVSFGNDGAAVLLIADQHRVPLRNLLGPGAPKTILVRNARAAVVKELCGLTNQRIGRIMRLSPEAVRQLRKRINAHRRTEKRPPTDS